MTPEKVAILNWLTTIEWRTAADLAKALAAYRRVAVSVKVTEQQLRALETAGAVTRQPRHEADGSVSASEYQLTEEGARLRLPGNLWSPHEPLEL
jgi:DNA-binding HxlR family transcriptional regulator